MKKLILILFFMFLARPAFADYTIDIKNEVGTVIKTYTITTSQVKHLQKTKTITGISVLDQFKQAFSDMVTFSKEVNKQHWRENNKTYIEDQASQ